MEITDLFPFLELLVEMRHEVRARLDPISRMRLRFASRAMNAEDVAYVLMPIMRDLLNGSELRDDVGRHEVTTVAYLGQWMALRGTRVWQWLAKEVVAAGKLEWHSVRLHLPDESIHLAGRMHVWCDAPYNGTYDRSLDLVLNRDCPQRTEPRRMKQVGKEETWKLAHRTILSYNAMEYTTGVVWREPNWTLETMYCKYCQRTWRNSTVWGVDLAAFLALRQHERVLVEDVLMGPDIDAQCNVDCAVQYKV